MLTKGCKRAGEEEKTNTCTVVTSHKVVAIAIAMHNQNVRDQWTSFRLAHHGKTTFSSGLKNTTDKRRAFQFNFALLGLDCSTRVQLLTTCLLATKES